MGNKDLEEMRQFLLNGDVFFRPEDAKGNELGTGENEATEQEESWV